MNAEFPGFLGKVWHDDEKMITMESYFVDHYPDEEFEKVTSMSKKELLAKSPKEIEESIIPMGMENSKYYCD